MFKIRLRTFRGRISGLVVRVPGHRSRDPGFGTRRYQISCEVMSLERGPLSLEHVTKELIEWVYKIEINGYGFPLRSPRNTLYQQKLTLTSPTCSDRSVGIVCLWTKATSLFQQHFTSS
jgi:hypothetical protein